MHDDNNPYWDFNRDWHYTLYLLIRWSEYYIIGKWVMLYTYVDGNSKNLEFWIFYKHVTQYIKMMNKWRHINCINYWNKYNKMCNCLSQNSSMICHVSCISSAICKQAVQCDQKYAGLYPNDTNLGLFHIRV